MEILFDLASDLTDPICHAHASYIQSQVVEQVARKIFFLLSAFFFASLALFTTLPGALLRGAASQMQAHPFLIEKIGKGFAKAREFTLFSWNVCCVAGGYAITDGGVTPWKERIEQIAQKIIEKKADVNCLYELFDLKAALYLKERLKQAGYTHFVYNVGPQGFGVSSGMMVASKYEIDQIAFDPFPQETLVGRTKWCQKGVLSFDLCGGSQSFARVFSTHLQHSEIPTSPTEEEERARHQQMQIVLEKMEKVRDRCLILTGDLNLEKREYQSSGWQSRFVKDGSLTGKSWGGDAFCAHLVGKPESPPLNLDYTLLWQGTAQKITSTLVETGYLASEYRQEALSDHEGIFSVIHL